MSDKFEFIDAEYAIYLESDQQYVPSIVKMCIWMEVSRRPSRWPPVIIRSARITILHSDRGSNYTSCQFAATLKSVTSGILSAVPGSATIM